MRYRLIALSVLMVLGVVSCSEDAPPSSSTAAPHAALADTARQPAEVPAERRVSPLMAAAAPAGPTVAPATLAPPADARWTLLCYTVTGESHVEASRVLKDALKKRTHRDDWYVIHGVESTKLYFGYYRTIEARDAKDRAEVTRAKADRTMVANFVADDGSQCFKNCVFVELVAPDPMSRPDWDLANIDREMAPRDPRRRFWSLQVMAFKDNAKRKEAAVQAVEALRKNNIEAYFYHGETTSSVCIGAWARLAVKEQEDDGTKLVGGPNTTLLVSSQPIPDEMRPKSLDSDGKPIIAVTPRLEVVDKGLLAAIKAWPDHAVNYEYKINHTPEGKAVRDSSFLVVIPRPKGNGYYDSEAEPSPIAGGDDRPNAGFLPDDRDTRAARPGALTNPLLQPGGSPQPARRPGGR
jgi:hypothetical protein